MSAIHEASVHMTKSGSYDSATRLSYIMELQRHIDTIDFAPMVIDRLISFQERQEATLLNSNQFDEMVSQIFDRGLIYNFYAEEVKECISDVLNFASRFMSVQQMVSPASTVYRTAVTDSGQLQVHSSVAEAYTRLLSHKLDIVESTKVLYRDIMRSIAESATQSTVSEDGDIFAAISAASARIASETKRGPGNFAIFSVTLAKRYLPAIDMKQIQETGLILHGKTPCGKIDLFVTDALDCEDIIVGYRGSSGIDAGLIFAPYAMFFGVEYTENTLYRGNIVNFADSKKYFRRITIKEYYE